MGSIPVGGAIDRKIIILRSFLYLKLEVKTLEDWKKELLSTAESIGKFTISVYEGLKKFVASETFKQLIEFLNNIPKDIQETELFKSISKLKDSEITYDTIEWFQNEILYDMSYETSIIALKNQATKTELDEYIISTIESPNLHYREKLVVLLAHFEAIVYQTMTYERVAKRSLKSVVLKSSKNLHEMDTESYKTLLVAGMVFIVFSDTDREDIYQNGIDKRIPFRNNILHRGTINYNDDEVKTAYEILVCFIAELAIIVEK